MIEGRCVLCCVTCKEVGLTISGHLHSNSHCTDTDDIYTFKKSPVYRNQEITRRMEYHKTLQVMKSYCILKKRHIYTRKFQT